MADDLRIIRSQGGFNAVLVSHGCDMAGTLAVLRCRGNDPSESLWLDAWRELQTATDAVCSMLEASAIEGSEASLGAQGVRLLTLSGEVTANTTAMSIREELGSQYGRNADHVRRAEDHVADLVGELVVADRVVPDAVDEAFRELRFLSQAVSYLAEHREAERLLFAVVSFEAACEKLAYGTDDGTRLNPQQRRLFAFAVLASNTSVISWPERSLLRSRLKANVSGEIFDFYDRLRHTEEGPAVLKHWSEMCSYTMFLADLAGQHADFLRAAQQYETSHVVETTPALERAIENNTFDASLSLMQKGSFLSRIEHIAVLLYYERRI